ncbi:forkhead box protein D1-like [Rhinopithecus roxellana]|uniref:forkhead box protein D1-like n=1 Tax=Rhinopithecus roxellana TaxID=61622 RepID=UPI0012379051|nr:forkhead box protein D1-like [Rhinopithecus roxellana]
MGGGRGRGAADSAAFNLTESQRGREPPATSPRDLSSALTLRGWGSGSACRTPADSPPKPPGHQRPQLGSPAAAPPSPAAPSARVTTPRCAGSALWFRSRIPTPLSPHEAPPSPPPRALGPGSSLSRRGGSRPGVLGVWDPGPGPAVAPPADAPTGCRLPGPWKLALGNLQGDLGLVCPVLGWGLLRSPHQIFLRPCSRTARSPGDPPPLMVVWELPARDPRH